MKMNIFAKLKAYYVRFSRERLNQKVLKKNPNAAIVNYEVLKKKSKMTRS